MSVFTAPSAPVPTGTPAAPPAVPQGQESVVRAEWSALFAADLEARRRRDLPARQILVGELSTSCQEDDAVESAEAAAEEQSGPGNSAAAEGDSEQQGRNNPNDNGTLTSILASYTAREKPKVYMKSGQRGVPAEELERVARTLHDCALAGKPKISLGVVVPELGEIRFDVQIAGKVVFIHAYVDNEQTSAALAAAVSGLRDRLEAHHLVLGRLDVTSPGAG